jgi:UDP-N-acetylmuramate dehydrogenase
MLAAGDSVRVSGGVPVASLLRRAAAEGWDGLEVISGIPGTIGGVVAMNGGTHLGEAADRLIEVRSIDLADGSGVVSTRTRDQLKFSYRKNHFLSPSEIVIDSVWKITHGEPKAIREKLDGLFRRKKLSHSNFLLVGVFLKTRLIRTSELGRSSIGSASAVIASGMPKFRKNIRTGS